MLRIEPVMTTWGLNSGLSGLIRTRAKFGMRWGFRICKEKNIFEKLIRYIYIMKSLV